MPVYARRRLQASVAVNRAIVFRIETFEPTESFNPAKPYKTRLKWRNLTGGEQSKLLLTEAETVIAELLDAKVELAKAPKRTARPPGAWPQRISTHGSVPQLSLPVRTGR